MNARHNIADHKLANDVGHLEMKRSIESGKGSATMTTCACPTRTGNLGLGDTDKHETALRNQANTRWATIERIDHAEHANHWGGVDVSALRFVIKTDVSANDWCIESHASFGHAVDRFGQLPHDFGVFGIAEVQTIHDCQGTSTNAREIQQRFSNRKRRALTRINRTPAMVAVGGERNAATGVGARGRMLQTKNCSIATGTFNSVEEQLMVVLREHPTRIGKEFEQFGCGVDRRRSRFGAHCASRSIKDCRHSDRTVVKRRIFVQRSGGDVAKDFAIETIANTEATAFGMTSGRTVGDDADNGRTNFPARTNFENLSEIGGLDNGKHAFLTFRGHDLERLHACFAARNGVDINIHTHAAATGGFARGTCKARATEILNADNETGVKKFETCFNEALFFVRIADLHRRALFSIGLFIGETGRSENADAADAVTTGARTQQNRKVANTSGLSEHEAFGRKNPEAQHVHQWVAGVGGIEHGFAADGGYAHRIAVTGNAADDAFGDPATARVVERTESQRIHQRDRTCAHREDVAQDAANTCGCTLVGLNCRGVIMRFDADGRCNSVANIDNAGIFARTNKHPRSFGGKTLEMHSRRLVGAVLGPHDREHRQLEVVGVAVEDLADVFVFGVSQAEGTVNRVIHCVQASAPEHHNSPGFDVTVVGFAVV